MNALQAARGVLEQILQQNGQKWSPELVEQAAQCVDLSTQIAARAALGEDVAALAGNVEAAMKLLVAAAGNIAKTVVLDSVAQAIRFALVRVLKLPIA